MATIPVNGVRLNVEITGTGGAPLVLIHGSWDSLRAWDPIVPRLAASFRVLAYDRRGHSGSERPAAQGSVAEDVADAAALIEHLGSGPAWVVGNSFGAAIALRLAGARPDLVRGVAAHEPPLVGVLAGDPAMEPLLAAVQERVAAVVQRIAAGDHVGAAEQFVDTVALGPGSWAQLPPEVRAILVENAPTFLDEAMDPGALQFDSAALAAYAGPVLLTLGGQSPPMFAPIVATLAKAAPRVRVRTLPGTGHIPHATHPDVYADTVLELVRAHAA